MTRSSLAAIVGMALVAGFARPAAVWGQDSAQLTGRWALKRELSQFPPEVGFGADWLPTGGVGAGAQPGAGGGRGRGRSGGGGGGAGVFTAPRESEDDAKRLQQLTAEVRTPPARLTIVEAPGAVTMTDDRGQSRTFHPDGKEEVLQLAGVPVAVTAKREAGRLSIVYKVEQGRELRYTYSRAAGASQLAVDTQFVERGGGDQVRRIYEPASETDPPPSPSATAPGPAAKPAQSPASAPAGLPASGGGLAGPTFNQQPDAELKGLTKLGVVVEDLSAQAAACGLNQGTLETAVSKRLSDAGFKVVRNSDEDSYAYVNVITASVSNGLCVSRYDVFLYTHTTATLSYQQAPVLVQVSLWHKGGISGGAPAAHGESVLKGVQEYVDQFIARVRDAGR